MKKGIADRLIRIARRLNPGALDIHFPVNGGIVTVKAEALVDHPDFIARMQRHQLQQARITAGQGGMG